MICKHWYMSRYLGGYAVRSMDSRKGKSYAPNYAKIV